MGVNSENNSQDLCKNEAKNRSLYEYYIVYCLLPPEFRWIKAVLFSANFLPTDFFQNSRDTIPIRPAGGTRYYVPGLPQ